MTNSIDLIPNDYREGVTRQRQLRGALWLAVVAAAASLLATLALNGAAKKLKAETEQLRTQYALSARQREQLDVLDARLAALDDEWTLLRGLRSGAAAEDLFVIVDRALPGGEVWFVDWTFRRAGVIAPQSPRTVNTGYFIVVPAGADEPPAEWQVMTHMSINGQARDHAALSRFVRGLYEQPQIRDVKVNNTRVRQYANSSVVDFEIAVVLHIEPAGQS